MAVVYDNDGTEKAQCQLSPRRVANIELPGTTIHRVIKGIPLSGTRPDRILRRAKQDARICLAVGLRGKQVSGSWCLSNVTPLPVWTTHRVPHRRTLQPSNQPASAILDSE
jgi:hypothetical protein